MKITLSVQKTNFFGFAYAKDLSQKVYMLLLSSAVNQYIIKVYHHKFTNKWPKQLSHNSHKGAKSIGQSK